MSDKAVEDSSDNTNSKDTAQANKATTNDTTSKIAGKQLPAPQPTTVPKTKGKNAAMPTESQPPTATKTRAKPASMPIKDKDHKEMLK